VALTAIKVCSLMIEPKRGIIRLSALSERTLDIVRSDLPGPGRMPYAFMLCGDYSRTSRKVPPASGSSYCVSRLEV
jgi:hypothetical protein